MARLRGLHTLGLVFLILAGNSTPAHARADEAMLKEFKAAFPELFRPQGSGRVRPLSVPDIFGPGAVLDVGSIHMKITNFGIIGNPFTNLSSDPSGQWPGVSGIEYLSFMALGVGAVNKNATDPAAIRRVSYFPEWRPQTLDPEDHMYRSYDGQPFGERLKDDDLDSQKANALDASLFLDEDFQDGRDNDGDGLIDEDFAALGQKMWSCVMWDNTAQALAATAAEKHVPLDLECRQTAFAYSVPGFENFNVINWTIYNRSGHGLDSMYIGVRTDVDAGPADSPTYFADDVDVPLFPYGDFPVVLSQDNEWGKKLDPKGNRRQQVHDVIPAVSAQAALCSLVVLRVNGFSVADNDGDEGRTKGLPSILLLGHTIDPNGIMAPRKVGWHGFRSHIAGTPYTSGGNPTTDQQRFEMFQDSSGINHETGFINVTPQDQDGDIQDWGMVGPFGVSDAAGLPHPIPDGGSIELTIAFGVAECSASLANGYPSDYELYVNDPALHPARDLLDKYPPLKNAFTAQVAYEGVYDNPPNELANNPNNPNINTTDFHGRETRVRAPQGFNLSSADCRDEGSQRQINEFGYTWFDYDCDYCTGVWAFGSGLGGGTGLFLRRWNTAAPPPNPNLNVSAAYNFSKHFSDDPDLVIPAGDKQVTLAWDNLSEVTVDPEKGDFDFRSYRVWKVANWRRPVGASGPADNDWALLGHFRFFDYAESNKEVFPDSVKGRFWPPARDSIASHLAICPQIFIPNVSLQTIVLSRSRFGDPGVAADWIRTHQDSLGRILRYDVARDLSSDADSWRFQQADGDCKIGTFRTVGLEDSTVTAEVCQNPLALDRGFKVPICLYRGDLWDMQSGEILRAAPVPCVKAGGACDTLRGKVVDTDGPYVYRTRYPVGRYRYVDREVKNGFIYFYSVSAGDSTSNGTIDTRDDELVSRRSAVEAEAVFPQGGTRPAGSVWVVPNPYRGYAAIDKRSSSWDLIPNSTDPTGTHVDFLGMPTGEWTISIYTVSGDLVQVLRWSDEVNESVRGPSFTRQQDNANDGQARWNLISRNGQDVVSGVYLFVVESKGGTQRGKFVIIR